MDIKSGNQFFYLLYADLSPKLSSLYLHIHSLELYDRYFIGRKLKRLSALRIFLYRESITNKGIKQLWLNIKRLPLLSSLSLRFANAKAMPMEEVALIYKYLGEFEISIKVKLDEEVFYLSQSLKRTQFLSSLFVAFWWKDGLINRGISSLYEIFKHNQILIESSLAFSGANTNDDGLLISFQGVKQLSNLIALKFGFDSCENLTKKELKISLTM